MAHITQAFVLGAGLGTRLRALTDELPKPLVPIFQKPLITFAFDHLIAAGCTRLIANTHHRAEHFATTFPDNSYRHVPIAFRHEPVLLETGGGIANIADLLADAPFLVYNADILTDLPLGPLIEGHSRHNNLVTLALRSSGGPQQIVFDDASGQILDIRAPAAAGATDAFVFTGVYVVEPEFLQRVERGLKRSVIPAFRDLISEGRLGGVILDEGRWWDVGTRAAYMQLHRDLPSLDFPFYPMIDAGWRSAIHPAAIVEGGVQLRGCSVVGAGATIGAEAILEDTIVWSGAQIASRSQLRNCIVRSHKSAEGFLSDIDI